MADYDSAGRTRIDAVREILPAVKLGEDVDPGDYLWLEADGRPPLDEVPEQYLTPAPE